jgi:hypothetical protein
MDRQQALDLLHEHVDADNLLKHCLATEAVMRALAERLDEPVDLWGLAGLAIMVPSFAWYWHAIPADLMMRAREVMTFPFDVIRQSYWFAGAIASYATEEQVDKLRAAKVSGDWRGYRGNLELIAALGVNAPGFPIVRPALAASAGERTSLVAAGLIHKDALATHEDVESIVQRTLTEYREFDAIKAAIIKKRRAELASLGRKDT